MTTLTYDPFATLLANYIVDEVKTGVTDAGYIPTEAPFYRQGLKVWATKLSDNVEIELTHIMDYTLSPNFASVSANTGKEAHTFIVLLKPALWKDLRITYRGVGGGVDTTLLDEITAAGAFDRTDPKLWLLFLGESIALRAASVHTSHRNKGVLEHIGLMFDLLATQLQRPTYTVSDSGAIAAQQSADDNSLLIAANTLAHQNNATAIEAAVTAANNAQTAANDAQADANVALAQRVPVGTILMMPSGILPSGYLVMNGASINRATYPDLYAFALASTLWVTQATKDGDPALIGAWGSGDGSVTFTLPDIRGEFLRVWDYGKGVDPARSIGTWQADQIKTHRHQTFNVRHNDYGGDWQGKSPNSTGDGIWGGYTGGDETRARNVAYPAFIKY